MEVEVKEKVEAEATVAQDEAREAGTLSLELTEPILNIVGQGVALGPLSRELLPTYLRWINDFGTLRTLGQPPLPMTMEQEARWFEGAATGAASIGFTIYRRDNLRPIGNTSLMDVDHRNRSAEFGILIGETDERGKGFGTETARLMLDYAFTALGLHSVMLRCYEFNLAGQAAYRKAGFREFGRRHQSRFMGGRLWDELYMEALADDFDSPVLSRVLVPDQPRSGAGSE